MSFKYDSEQPAGERVHSVTVYEDGEETALDLDRTYTVAMNNFTAAGGDGYDVFGKAWEDNRYTIVGTTDWEVLRDHALALLEEEGEVSPVVEGRIVDTEATEDSDKPSTGGGSSSTPSTPTPPEEEPEEPIEVTDEISVEDVTTEGEVSVANVTVAEGADKATITLPQALRTDVDSIKITSTGTYTVDIPMSALTSFSTEEDLIVTVDKVETTVDETEATAVSTQYNFNISDASGNSFTEFGEDEVALTFSLTESNDQTLALQGLYVSPTGEYEYFDGAYDETTNTYTFNVDHFSQFGVVLVKPTSVLDARNLDKGSNVLVEGIVTASFEAGGQTNMYIQDESAALLVRGSGLGALYNEGDRVQFKGEMSDYYDMLQLLVDDSEFIGEDEVMTPALVDETFFTGEHNDTQAKLVQVEDIEVLSDEGYNNYKVSTPTGEFTILASSVSLDVGDTFDMVTGVVNYDYSELKLMPRGEWDLIVDATITQPVRSDVEPGKVASGTEVSLTSGTDEATIYYTLDGSTPTENSLVYTAPIVIDDVTTIKAIAVAEGLSTSDVSTFTFDLLAEAGSLEIYDIQGAQHVSPYEGQLVREVPGIVTHVETNGFYFQSETGDDNINTSDAIHVYARGHDVSVGDFVEVTGEVVEYAEDGYDDNDDLTTTQIEATFVDVISQDNALPEAFVIGIDREIPSVPFVDFESYNPLDPSMFDASVNAIDYMESLEAMYVEIPGQVTVTGPQKYGELTVVSEEWHLDNRTPSGGVYLEASTQGDFAPEMITEVLFVNVSDSTVAKTGDYFAESIEGIVGYNFGNFKIEPTVDGLPMLNDGDNTRRNETTINFAEDKLTVASYNVENFRPEESEAKANKLAESMANELNTPDILGLVEVMDSYGETVGPDTSAHESYQIFIDKIFDLTGVKYAYTEVAPVQGEDGGIPGGEYPCWLSLPY